VSGNNKKAAAGRDGKQNVDAVSQVSKEETVEEEELEHAFFLDPEMSP